jgi:hypothetical protein
VSCQDCLTARETLGEHRLFDPKCLYCGARCIRRIPKFCGTDAEAVQRRRVVLRDWMAMGHSEAELRELARGKTLAYEPVTNAPAPTSAKPGKRSKVKAKEAANA